MTSPLGVRSEAGRLRRVLVHSPGREWDLVPCGHGNIQERYLVEDIFSLEQAQKEYAHFKQVLVSFVGLENVLELRDLLSKVLGQPERRSQIIAAIAAHESLGFGAINALEKHAADEGAEALTDALICGATLKMRDLKESYRNMFDPIPNLLFTRDIGVMLPGAFLVGHAAMPARKRETLLMRHMANWSDEFHSVRKIDVADRVFDVFWERGHGERVAIEGGDVLVVRDDLLLIGVGQRTSASALNIIVPDIFRNTTIQQVLEVHIPAERAAMHLDTIFTVLNRNEWIGFTQIVNEISRLTLWRKSGSSHYSKRDIEGSGILFTVLKKEFGISPMWLRCGGSSQLYAYREQWSDGANLFALAPGVVMGYRRNEVTAAELARAEFQQVRAEDTMAVEALAEKVKRGEPVKALITIPDSELSKARGGPRCMTMPLARDPIS